MGSWPCTTPPQRLRMPLGRRHLLGPLSYMVSTIAYRSHTRQKAKVSKGGLHLSRPPSRQSESCRHSAPQMESDPPRNPERVPLPPANAEEAGEEGILILLLLRPATAEDHTRRLRRPERVRRRQRGARGQPPRGTAPGSTSSSSSTSATTTRGRGSLAGALELRRGEFRRRQDERRRAIVAHRVPMLNRPGGPSGSTNSSTDSSRRRRRITRPAAGAQARPIVVVVAVVSVVIIVVLNDGLSSRTGGSRGRSKSKRRPRSTTRGLRPTSTAPMRRDHLFFLAPAAAPAETGAAAAGEEIARNGTADSSAGGLAPRYPTLAPSSHGWPPTSGGSTPLTGDREGAEAGTEAGAPEPTGSESASSRRAEAKDARDDDRTLAPTEGAEGTDGAAGARAGRNCGAGRSEGTGGGVTGATKGGEGPGTEAASLLTRDLSGGAGAEATGKPGAGPSRGSASRVRRTGSSSSGTAGPISPAGARDGLRTDDDPDGGVERPGTADTRAGESAGRAPPASSSNSMEPLATMAVEEMRVVLADEVRQLHRVNARGQKQQQVREAGDGLSNAQTPRLAVETPEEGELAGVGGGRRDVAAHAALGPRRPARQAETVRLQADATKQAEAPITRGVTLLVMPQRRTLPCRHSIALQVDWKTSLSRHRHVVPRSAIDSGPRAQARKRNLGFLRVIANKKKTNILV